MFVVAIIGGEPFVVEEDARFLPLVGRRLFAAPPILNLVPEGVRKGVHQLLTFIDGLVVGFAARYAVLVKGLVRFEHLQP